MKIVSFFETNPLSKGGFFNRIHPLLQTVARGDADKFRSLKIRREKFKKALTKAFVWCIMLVWLAKANQKSVGGDRI